MARAKRTQAYHRLTAPISLWSGPAEPGVQVEQGVPEAGDRSLGDAGADLAGAVPRAGCRCHLRRDAELDDLAERRRRRRARKPTSAA